MLYTVEYFFILHLANSTFRTKESLAKSYAHKGAVYLKQKIINVNLPLRLI